MTAPGGVNIERVEIENIFIFPGAAPEGDFSGIFDFINDQLKAGADPKIMHDDGYPVAEDASVEQQEPPRPQEQAKAEAGEAEELQARYNEARVKERAQYLHHVAEHITEVRHIEGMRRQPGHTPKELKALDRRHDSEMDTANSELEEACRLCDFKDDCKLVDSAKLWADAHPYQNDRTGKKRAKTSPKIKAVEPREGFLQLLDAGVEAKEQVHCNPAERDEV